MTTSKVSSASTQTTKYLYDHNNNRYLKYTEDTVRVKGKMVTRTIAEDRYVSSLYQIDMAGAKKDHVYLGSQKLGTLNNSSTLYFDLSDHLGSQSTRTDATGAVTERRDYKPYGTNSYENIPTDTGNRYKFTGKERDQETTFDYFGARYYDSGLGRFGSVDPVLFALNDEQKIKGVTGNDIKKVLSDPQSLNSYAYARNNPLRLVDPDGQWYGEFFTFHQSWNSFQLELGQAADQLYNSSGAWRMAMDHPYASGAVIGVGSGLAAYGGTAALTELSTSYLGGIGTGCLAFCSQADKAVKLLNNTGSLLSSDQRQLISDTIQNEKLQKIFNSLYRATDKFPGGTAGAVKYERATGELLSKSGHLYKAQTSINALNKVLQSPELSRVDYAIAGQLMDQLKDVIK